MPPTNPPFDPKDHLLPPAQRSPIGPVVGIVIILALLIFGALYFWGGHLKARDNPENNLPLIQGDASTTIQY